SRRRRRPAPRVVDRGRHPARRAAAAPVAESWRSLADRPFVAVARKPPRSTRAPSLQLARHSKSSPRAGAGAARGRRGGTSRKPLRGSSAVTTEAAASERRRALLLPATTWSAPVPRRRPRAAPASALAAKRSANALLHSAPHRTRP